MPSCAERRALQAPREHHSTPRPRWALILAVAAATLKFAAVAVAAGTITVHLCGSYTPGSGRNGGTNGVAHTRLLAGGITAPFDCPASSGAGYQGLDVLGSGSASNGTRGMWEVDAPSGFLIQSFHTEGAGMFSYGVNSTTGWGGGWYWSGGGAQVAQGETSYSSPTINSPYFGWQIVCGKAACDGANSPSEIAVLGLSITATESSGPTVSASPGSLGTAGDWVRGTWPIRFGADGPTGACEMAATFGGTSVSEPVSEPQNDTVWHQCPAGSFDQPFNTASVPSGASVPLDMMASDAASNTATDAVGVNVDNDPVSVSLAGPTQALSTAGTQYVTATGTAGPSGVSGLTCTIDGSTPESYSGASAQIPVSGAGSHAVSCYAANNARDSAGAVATSPTETWTLDIQQPTVSSIGFAKLLDPMRCHKTSKVVEVPGHWTRVRRGKKTVRKYVKARSARTRVTVCHPRIVKKRVAVWRTVVRHKKKVRVKHYKTIKVAVYPHVKMDAKRHVDFGKRTTISGWLGTSAGVALGGQHVTVLAAPDNGAGQFKPIGTAVTATDGSWTARIPAGPSRLIEASYAGSSTLAQSGSAQVTELVPARVKLLSVSPSWVGWGKTVRIRGRLVGGYLPASGELVRLRIGFGKAYTTYGVEEHVTGKGYFSTTYTFGAGVPSVLRSYWFQVASLPVGDYPYQPTASRRVSVTVGGYPPPPKTKPSHRHETKSAKHR